MAAARDAHSGWATTAAAAAATTAGTESGRMHHA
jgi:hypothetical protein